MKAYLLDRDRDFDLQTPLPPNETALTQDLALSTLFGAMADGDDFLFQVARRALLSSLNNDLSTIIYRQEVLKDCQNNPSVVKEIYQLTVKAIESEKKNYRSLFSGYPTGILDRSIEVLQMFLAGPNELENHRA